MYSTTTAFMDDCLKTLDYYIIISMISGNYIHFIYFIFVKRSHVWNLQEDLTVSVSLVTNNLYA